MPNHLHGLVCLNPANADDVQWPLAIGECRPVDRRSPTFGQVIRTFKAVVTRRIHKAGVGAFAWQRNYYERIIRNQDELDRARQYIRDNPARWAEDHENPERDGARGPHG